MHWRPEVYRVSTEDRKTDKRATVKRGKRRAKATARPAKKKGTLSFHSSAYPLHPRLARRRSAKETQVQPRFKAVTQLPILTVVTPIYTENFHGQ